MIELKITVDKAVELEQEVKDLYQSIVGAPVKEIENWTTNDVKPAKKEAPKAEPVKEEASAPKKEPAKAEGPKVEIPSLEAFLDSIGAEKVTSATDEQRIQIMEWVNSRG